PLQQLTGGGPATHADRGGGQGGHRRGAEPRAGPVAVFRAVPDRRHVLLRRDARGAQRERPCRPAERGVLSYSGRPKNPGGGVGDGVAVPSTGTAAPRVNRRRSAPVSTRAGNGSPAALRVSAGTGSGAADPTSTRLPNRRPCSSCGAAITATSGNTVMTAATWVRANASVPPSATFAA